MMTIPFVVTVAQLQRTYRDLVEKIKKVKEPMIVLSNGKPDVVVMDIETYKCQSQKFREMEENYLLSVYKEGIEESRQGKTIKLRKNQKLLDLIK